LNVINPRSIESIDIIKGLEAQQKYGDEGKNGVVLITLKEAARKED
jgi:bla regulator protein BlaR1